MSLDLLFWKSLIILDISFELHSSTNIEFIFEGITYSLKEQKPISEIVCSFMLSFRFDAIELTYLLNPLAIIRLSRIFWLSMINGGLRLLLVFPLSSLIIFHVFFLSSLFSRILSLKYEFLALLIMNLRALL